MWVKIQAWPGIYNFACLIDADLTSDVDEELESAFYEEAKKLEAKHPELTIGDLIDHSVQVPDYTLLGQTINNDSIVMMLYYQSIKMLFAGDIEEAEGRDLAADYCTLFFNKCRKLNCDILKIPHHGSGHFSSDFVRFADGRRFGDGLVLDQRRLDLEGPDQVAAGVDHVVVTAAEPEVAVLVDARAATADVPAVD